MSKSFKRVAGGPSNAAIGLRIPVFEKHKSSDGPDVGFRLVFSDADKLFRGGSWVGDFRDPRKCSSHYGHPANSVGYVSFRLVREDT